MFAKKKSSSSTPEAWVDNFAPRSRVQDALAERKLNLGIDGRLRRLKSDLAPRARVLDVGCGRGTWGGVLERRGYLAYGIDFAPALVTYAAARYPSARWVVGSGDRLPFATDSMDAVISWGVIEHYEEGPEEILGEFARVIRPGGRVFVTVPLDSDRQRRVASVMSRPDQSETFFAWYLTKPELAAALVAAGFRIETVREANRSAHLVAPKLYARLSETAPLARDVMIQLLKPVLLFAPNSVHMILAVGTNDK